MKTEKKENEFGEFHITPNFTIKADDLEEREKFIQAGMKEKAKRMHKEYRII